MKLSLFIALLMFSGVANATDYYVSNSGNNSNNGTSQTTSWKTLSKVQTVCNNGTIKAGDNIYFKKGDIWAETLLLASIWGYSANSGTATLPITLSSYGTGAKPVFQYPAGATNVVSERSIMWIMGVSYIVIDGINFTDLAHPTNDKVSPAYCAFAMYLGISGEVTTNHCTLKNIEVSLLGMGIAIAGDYNTITNSTFTNFKNLVSTSGAGGDDYGANPFTILDGNNNSITNNYVSGGWAESLDFGYNGGFCEMYGACNNNKFMYNTIIDCNGLSEFGGSGANLDNLYAYNKVIDCGAMYWVNSGAQVGNIQFFNNTVIETNNSRFSLGSANAGAGVVSPEALSHLNVDSYMFAYNGSPSASVVFNLKNNIFQILTPLKISRSSETKLSHDYNVAKFSGGSAFGLPLNTHDRSTTASIFTNTIASNAASWDLNPLPGSPAIDAGTNVGITQDFMGNPVPSVPNAGILETVSGGSTLGATSTAGTISCNGSTTTVTVTATGGTAPYSGTGTFTVSAGTYTYSVTDATGTIRTTTITIIQPTVLTGALSSGTITTYSGTTTITASANGGTSPYIYNINGGTFQSSNVFSGIAAGTYTIVIKDNKGCTSTKTITITQPAPPTTLAASSSAGIIGCNGGTANVTVSATGGVAPYTGTGTFTKSAGTYNYTVTDALGATATTSITLTQPAAINLVITPGTITINGGTTTIAANASGGTPTFSYKLNSGNYQSSGSFTGVGAGSHTITAKDKNGCTTSQTITITEPSSTTPLVVSATSGFIACNGGTTTVVVSASGGVLPYTGTGNFTASAGTRTYTVTDAAGTVSTKTLTIVQPKIILVSAYAGTIATYGGSTTLTVYASGGTGTTYSYKLNSGAYQSSNTFSNVIAGTYTVTVKDVRNCTGTANITISQSSGVFTTTLVAKTNVTCSGANNGTIQVAGNFGVPPYKFKRSNGFYSSASLFTNLSPGTYTITGKDAVGAISSIQVNIANSSVACKMAGKGSSNATAAVNNDDALQVKGLEVTAFPNPSSTQFSLMVKSDNDEAIHITVMNMNGQKVYESISSINKKNTFGDSFIPGIYFVKVTQGNHLQTIRLIKTQ